MYTSNNKRTNYFGYDDTRHHVEMANKTCHNNEFGKYESKTKLKSESETERQREIQN